MVLRAILLINGFFAKINNFSLLCFQLLAAIEFITSTFLRVCHAQPFHYSFLLKFKYDAVAHLWWKLVKKKLIDIKMGEREMSMVKTSRYIMRYCWCLDIDILGRYFNGDLINHFNKDHIKVSSKRTDPSYQS